MRRIGLNEALFRELNERLSALDEAFAPTTEAMELVCECGDAGCTERITMTPAQYEQLRADPATFAVVRGHASADVEAVEERGDYDVLRKEPGLPRRLAEATDPRS